MKDELRKTKDKAYLALKHGDLKTVLEAANTLLESDYSPVHGEAHWLRGAVFEFGGNGVNRDIKKSIASYRKAAYIVPHSRTYLSLARALMHSDQENASDAFRFIVEAEKLAIGADVYLAYARYYESQMVDDLTSASKYYFKAALRGRFTGFFGYSRCARKTGKKVRAGLMDVARVSLGPIIFLLLGRKASAVY